MSMKQSTIVFSPASDAGMRSNSTSLDLNDPSLPGANAGPYDPTQVLKYFKNFFASSANILLSEDL